MDTLYHIPRDTFNMALMLNVYMFMHATHRQSCCMRITAVRGPLFLFLLLLKAHPTR